MAKRTSLSHVTPGGQARMVDVSGKAQSSRHALAEAWVDVGRAVAAKLRQSGGVAKGNVLETTRLAAYPGRQADRQPYSPMPPAAAGVRRGRGPSGRPARADRRLRACQGKTGVEMEAMTAACVAALTVYDMVKAAGQGRRDRPDPPAGKVRRKERPLEEEPRTMAKIEALCVSEKKGEPKRPVAAAEFRRDHGIVGDAHAGPWHRQVSLLAAEDVDAARAKLPDLRPGDFAENVLLGGVDLRLLGLGSRLRLGGEVVLSVTQIGKVCHAPCRIGQALGDCIMPRRGLFARVEAGGRVSTGDAVELLEVVSPELKQAVVLTISDRCSRGEAQDTAGPAAARRLAESGARASTALRSYPTSGTQSPRGCDTTATATRLTWC